MLSIAGGGFPTVGMCPGWQALNRLAGTLISLLYIAARLIIAGLRLSSREKLAGRRGMDNGSGTLGAAARHRSGCQFLWSPMEKPTDRVPKMEQSRRKNRTSLAFGGGIDWSAMIRVNGGSGEVISVHITYAIGTPKNENSVDRILEIHYCDTER
jgi:hypothetical protein